MSVVRDYGIVFSFVALFVILSLSSDVFLTPINLINVLDQSSAVGIIACAGTLVIIAGGFDLSVGAIFGLACIVCAAVTNRTNPIVGIAAGLAVGTLFGGLNGLLTTVGRINTFIATLASSIMIEGLALVLSGGLLIVVNDPTFTVVARGDLFQVRYPILIWVAFALAMGFMLNWTRFGRYVFACGGNAEAARFSGVRVGWIRGVTFALSGLAAGLAGIVVTSRIATGQPNGGTDLPLNAIAAIAIGGTSIMGGEGAIWRTILGVLLLTLIGNGFNLLGVDPTYQRIFQGAIIVAAVGVDAWTRRSR